MFDPFDDAFGLLALDDGAKRGEVGLGFWQEHVRVRLLSLYADSLSQRVKRQERNFFPTLARRASEWFRQ